MESNNTRKFHISSIDAFDGLDRNTQCVDSNPNPLDEECACWLSVDHLDDGTPCACPCGLTW